ncbi:hypothetical protein GE09DRAFT_134060 [Coniochaeta sp. 2T2.1]|nr:hypothetical protein GE09DRAFT_134060 [Coniochaeta sp. 2T2.1]
MRLQWSTSFLLTISVCSDISFSLPISEQHPDEAAVLAPRYSVVPIDGGLGSGGSGGSGGGASGDNGGAGASPVTVVQTVTLLPKTTETVSRSSPPETQRVTDTIVLTASPVAVVTQTAILTVDIDQPADTKTETSVVYITPSLPPSSSSPSTSSPPVSSRTPPSSHPTQSVTLSTSVSVSWQTASSSPTETPTAVSTTFSSILQTSIQTSSLQTATMQSGSTTLFPTTTTGTTTTFSPLSTSSRTFDNGQWHTTYPAWNGTMIRRFSRS